MGDMRRYAGTVLFVVLLSCGGTQEGSETPAEATTPTAANAAMNVQDEPDTFEYVQHRTDMEPTITVGQQVRISRTQAVRPGQVVLVRLPTSFNEEGGTEEPMAPTLLRVIGVEGDTIHQDDDGVVSVNGARVDGDVVPCPALTVSSSVVCRSSALGDSRFITATNSSAHGETTVPPLPVGYIDVRGDARSYSLGSESPDISAVPVTAVEGVVIGL